MGSTKQKPSSEPEDDDDSDILRASGRKTYALLRVASWVPGEKPDSLLNLVPFASNSGQMGAGGIRGFQSRHPGDAAPDSKQNRDSF